MSIKTVRSTSFLLKLNIFNDVEKLSILIPKAKNKKNIHRELVYFVNSVFINIKKSILFKSKIFNFFLSLFVNG